MQASGSTGLLHKYYEGLLAKGMKPALARLTVARKMATITWIVWKGTVKLTEPRRDSTQSDGNN